MTSQRKRIGPYRLLKQIGQGGMGVVYQAVHEVLQREVAIKELLGSGSKDKEAMERFRREGMALAQLRHESVVGIHDLFVAREKLYMVLEFVNGCTLRELLEKGPLPWDVAAIIGMRLASALEHAHHHQVIHRDLKPANVMVSRSGEVKLMDFGIARDQTLSTLTGTGLAMGTPMYMAPEVITGNKADGQTDLYSLGVLLYECVSGQRPYSGVQPEKIFKAILTGKHPPLQKASKNVPKQLAKIIERCMKVDPKKRFATAADLRVELELFLVECGARANHRQRIIGYLHAEQKISETEALTCINAADLMMTSQAEVKAPGPSPLRVLAAAASVALAIGAWFAAQRPEMLTSLLGR